MGGIRIAIIDDHPLFRAGVAQSLQESGGFEVVAQGGTRDDALEIIGKHDADILLLDVSIPGGGLEALNAIAASHPNLKVVMLTVSESGGDVIRAMRAGARGYVLKGIEAGSLQRILQSIAAGERYVSPALSARLLSDGAEPGQAYHRSPADALDDRQRRIMDLVSAGFSNKEIAIELNLQEKTIKHQMTRIFSKLTVSNRTEAAMVFRGALRPPGAPPAEASGYGRMPEPHG